MDNAHSKSRFWTKKQDKILLSKYPNTTNDVLAKTLGRSVQAIYARAIILGVKKSKKFLATYGSQFKKGSQVGQAHRYSKGHVPANKGKKMPPEVYEKVKKTMFKKGNIPSNAKERDGIITIRHDHCKRRNNKPYKWIRIRLGEWQLYHQYRWEQFRGKVPPGYCLWFKDGDTMNVKISNLECITRSENARRNKMKFERYPTVLKQVIKLQNKINNKIHEKFNRRNKKHIDGTTA